ncbi:hypothetical protein, partial [Kitasatospora sp. GAS1066B]|uniref:hypothetical protein n=1 Tax=Kitasatospora sp. GAS1066B TaxID=3156271 RepID=UPI003514D3B9
MKPGQPLLGLFDPGCAAVELVEPLGVCRSTLWNAINDVLPVLDDHRLAITPAEHHYATAADVLGRVFKVASDRSAALGARLGVRPGRPRTGSYL